MTQVAIIILSYNARDDLLACLRSLELSAPSDRDAGLETHIAVVDNASTDGSLEAVRQRFARVRCVPCETNLGFAEGNNVGWRFVRSAWPETKYVVLLNQDTLVTPGWLSPLVRVLEEHDEAAAVQAKLRLHPDTDRLNSAGNRSHYLGFGFTVGADARDVGQYDEAREIDFPSGAAVMIRASMLRQFGLFEPGFFLYLEDAELGWRLRQTGHTIRYEPTSVVYHKYSFDGTLRHYRHLERNRWWLLLVYYRWRTLLLLSPALGLMELGQLFFAARRGLMMQKVSACAWYLHPGHLLAVWRSRRAAKGRRVLTDRQFMAGYAGRIESPTLNRGVMRWVANPVLGGYWAAVRGLIRW